MARADASALRWADVGKAQFVMLARDRLPIAMAEEEHCIRADECFSHDPRERYPDAEALAADVAAYLAGRRVQAHRYTALELALPLARVWRMPLGIVGGALLVIATILVLGNLSLRTQRDRARAAENEARAALTTSDQHLATALVAQAHAADRPTSARREGGDRRPRAAPRRVPGRARRARGGPAAARPTRLASAEIPSCRPLVALAVDDLLCADDLVLRRLTAGVERCTDLVTRPAF